MAKTDIWMPVFVGDYLRDTQELTAEEHGVYFLLLIHYWQRQGNIGADIARLAVVARSSQETTKFILNRFFHLMDDGYKNKRADEELASASVRSEAARANARRRWNRDIDATAMRSHYDGNASGDAKPMPSRCSSPSPSPSPSDITIRDIVRHLNSRTGAVFRPEAKKTTRHINARISEGFTLDDFKTVIDHKSDQWLKDAKMREYLRPETLFGTKMEGYLQEARRTGPTETGLPLDERNILDIKEA